MATGIIKFYNAEKDFGFIVYEHGEDVFFHVSNCGIENPDSLRVGQAVDFEIIEGKKGMDARQLTINPNPDPDLAGKLSPKMKPKPRKYVLQHTGEHYMAKQIKFKTPMVFELYTESICCTVKQLLKYDLNLLCGKDIRQIHKLDIKYCYKQEYEQSVKANIRYDEDVKSQSLEPLKPMKERYQIQDTPLQKARRDKAKIRLILRGGEIIEGTIDWFSPYEIKVEFSEGSSIPLHPDRSGSRDRPKGNVIAYRHAVYDCAILDGQESKAKEEPQKVKEEKPKENVVEVSITSEQAVLGTRVRITLPNGRKGSVPLPAGISDGKRFRLKKHNLLLVVSVED